MTQTAILTADDGVANDLLGESVAIAGDTIVAGASGDGCTKGIACGSAYVFEKPVGGWVDGAQNAILRAQDPGATDLFG